jgi:hypothetical protein
MSEHLRTVAFVIAAAAACSSPSTSTSTETPPSTAPTYETDVRPILERHCFDCHTSNAGLGGITLDTYRGALVAATHLQHAVGGREMPPWGADDSGRCGTWTDSRSLSPSEIETILDWAAGGTAKGSGPATSSPPAAPRPMLAGDVAAFEVGDAYEPDVAGKSERCFFVDPKLDRDRFVTGIAYNPHAPNCVMNVQLYAVDDPAAEATAAALEGADGAPGFPCAGRQNLDAFRFVVGVGMGSSAIRLPSGTGVRVAAGRRLVAQLDYNLFSGTAGDRGATVRLGLADDVTPAEWTAAAAAPFALSPNAADSTATARLVIPADRDVLAVYPEMRLFGKSMTVLVDYPSGAGRQCLLDEVSWQFHLLREPRVSVSPISLKAGSMVSVTCHYDTYASTETIRSGDTLDDEACSLLLYSAAKSP